ncbi:MAG: thiamine phosphate synthase [Deltaproteobacteria bacterium]|nr:thiamine phosphate synthase [Deltaproteobacteria bacterium]
MGEDMKALRKRIFAEVDLYPVTCRRLSAGRSDLEVLAAVIQGGSRIIQLREKELGGRDFYELALKFRELTANAEVLLIINDHLDIALAVEADGVHLGQEDLPLAAARRIAPDLLIGASSHSREEALAAERSGADYVNIGPLFPTGTKEIKTPLLGVGAIAAIAPHLTIPFTVMGGINGANIDAVVAAGARRVAVVTAVTQAPDMAAAVAELRRRINAPSPAFKRKRAGA